MKRSSISRAALTLAIFVLPAAAMAAGHRSGMDWFSEHLVNAIIHAVVYGLIFKIFHAIGLVPSIILGAALLFGAHWWFRRRSSAAA